MNYEHCEDSGQSRMGGPGELWHLDGTAKLVRDEFLTNLSDAHRYPDWLHAS